MSSTPRLAFLLALAASVTHAAETDTPAATPAPVTSATTRATPADTKAESYSLGLSFAAQWHEAGIEGVVSTEDLIRGIRAGLAGTTLTADDRQRASSLMRMAYEGWAGRNKEQAGAFLVHNAKEAGVKTTDSGLQYLVLKPGAAGSSAPRPSDHVTVQYRGHLLNGYEFDTTYNRTKPTVIRPSDVIAGWREALGMMGRGAQWRLFIPPELAYGTTPPPSIPPNSLLIFDVEVVSVEPHS